MSKQVVITDVNKSDGNDSMLNRIIIEGTNGVQGRRLHRPLRLVRGEVLVVEDLPLAERAALVIFVHIGDSFWYAVRLAGTCWPAGAHSLCSRKRSLFK